jgi:hypothetical protein
MTRGSDDPCPMILPRRSALCFKNIFHIVQEVLCPFQDWKGHRLVYTYVPGLRCWVQEFPFQVTVSLECRPFEKLNRSNRIRLCDFLKHDLPDLDLKIR